MSSAVSSTKASRQSNKANGPPPGFWADIWRFLSSLRLLLVTLFVGAVPLTVGTFFVQKPLGQFNPEEAIERMGPQMYALLETFNIFNIYHSWYFQAILLSISINNICCTIDRFFIKMKRLTSKAVGVIIVHIGVNTVLAGSFYSSRVGVEGFMQVFENAPPKSVMLNFFKEEEIELPFSVQLDDFRLQLWEEADERVFLVDMATRETQDVMQLDHSRPFPQTFRRGRKDYLAQMTDRFRGGPPDAIRVDEYYPDAAIKTIARPSTDPDAPWVVKLATRTPQEVGSGYLTADEGNRLTILPGRLTAAYVRAKTEARFTQLLGSHVGAEVTGPTLIVRDRESRLETAYAAGAGAEIVLPDDNGTVRVLEYTDSYGSGATGKPAVRVELVDEDGPRIAWLLANFSGSALQSDWVTIRFLEGASSAATAGDEVDFIAGPAGERKLVHRQGRRVVEVRDAPPGTTVTLPELGVTLEAMEYVDGATFGLEAVKRSDGLGTPAIKVALISGGEVVFSDWLLPGQPADLPDTTLRFVYDRDFGIKEFQSDLSIYKDGRKIIDRQEIIVNRYLAVEGYHIYQASYDEENGHWSGLSIKRDPGLKITYTGFCFMFAGVFFLFYIRPIMEARRTGRPLFSGNNNGEWRRSGGRYRGRGGFDTLGSRGVRHRRPRGGA